MDSSQQTTVIQAGEMRGWMPHPIRNWDERFTLFYDETNNIRRLKLSEVGLNVPENKAFVLAGIALREGQTRAGIADLRRALRLNANAPELKTRHIAEGDFETMLTSRRLQTFLAWLLANDLSVHYSVLDVLYWALIDIVESFQGKDAVVALHHRELKNELYYLVSGDPHSFMQLLHGFSYPNIARAAVRPFLSEIVDFLENQAATDRNAATFLLKRQLRAARRVDELPFLHDNEDGELIRDFSGHFLRSVYVFKNATHVFDRETEIERTLSSTEVREGDRRLDYRFADSQHEEGIQVSDVVAGLFGKYFTYLQEHQLPMLLERKSKFTGQQRDNLALLRALIDRSDEVSDGFCHSVIPLDTAFKNDAFLHERTVPEFLYSQE